jgi:hypothetical protein
MSKSQVLTRRVACDVRHRGRSHFLRDQFIYYAPLCIHTTIANEVIAIKTTNNLFLLNFI